MSIGLKQSDPQDTADRIQRETQAAKLAKELVKIIFNRRGLERLRKISDEDWQRADDTQKNNNA